MSPKRHIEFDKDIIKHIENSLAIHIEILFPDKIIISQKNVKINKMQSYRPCDLHNINKLTLDSTQMANMEREDTMIKIIGDRIWSHFKENIISYILLFAFFMGGVIIGGYITKGYKSEDITILSDFFDESMSVFLVETPDYNSIFKNTFTGSVKDLAFVWILGFTVIGVPVIFLKALKTGFMMGFTSTFLISLYSSKGILISLALIFVKCIIYLPAIFFISVYAISLSSELVKIIFGRIKYKINFKYYILTYIMTFAMCVPIMVIYSLFEAYLTANVLVLLFT